MRKLPLLLGTLGGAMAGYLFSNKKLRDELSGAQNAEHAGKILAAHMQKDGKQIGAEVQKFVQSSVVQENLGKAKKMAQGYAKKWQGEVKTFVKGSAKKAKSSVKRAVSKHRAPKRSVMKKRASKS